jgi:hypothetical protein
MPVCQCVHGIRFFVYRYKRASIGGSLACYGWRHLMRSPVVGCNRVEEDTTKLVGINMASRLPRDIGLSPIGGTVGPTSTESGSRSRARL